MNLDDLADDDFLARLEAADLPAGSYNHRAHIRTGFLYVERHGFESAVKRMRKTLVDFTIAVGAQGKYHETITVAFLDLINQRLAGQCPGDWKSFLEANPDLLDGAILLKYYDPDVLKSDQARASYIPPTASAA
jgi:hypothetical protein